MKNYTQNFVWDINFRIIMTIVYNNIIYQYSLIYKKFTRQNRQYYIIIYSNKKVKEKMYLLVYFIKI